MASRSATQLGSLISHPEAIRRLRYALHSNGYAGSTVKDAVRLRKLAGRSGRAVNWRAIAGEDGPLTTLIELFTLGRAVETERAADALVPLSLEDALRAGLVQVEGDYTFSPFEIAPHEDLLLLGDRPDLMTEGNVQFVATVSNSARTLGHYTDRSPVAETLDLGSGSGVQALLAAPRSDQVLGIDINPRAVAIAEANGYLNEVANVEYRVSDWFEAIEEERRFELVVANLPFIVAPEVVFQFAHGGFDPNELSERMLRGVAERIGSGGRAQLLMSWTRREDEDRLARIRGFMEGIDCDALVLCVGSEAVSAYAIEQCSWLAPDDSRRFGELLDLWLSYYGSIGADFVEYGLVTLRPRPSGTAWVRGVDAPRAVSEPCGDHLPRIFAGNDFLDGLGADADLLDAHVTLPAQHRLTQVAQHGSDGYRQEPTMLELIPDVGYGLLIPPDAAAAVFSISGQERLSETVGRVAAETGLEEAALRNTTAGVLRDLLSVGLAVPPTAPTGGKSG